MARERGGQERVNELLVGAIERLSPDADVEFLRTWWGSPATRAGVTEQSRQARHARIARARRKAVAGSMVLAASEPEYESMVYTPEFARLRPISADCHRGAYALAEAGGEHVASAAPALWDQSERHLFDIARRIDRSSRDELLSIATALGGLLFAAVTCGAALAPAWRSLWRRARRQRLLDQPWIRLQLCIAGTYVGECAQHVDWLLDPRMRPFDRLDTWLFAARGQDEDLLDATARLARGEGMDPETAFASSRLVTVLVELGDWIKMCMRQPLHVQNEGQALMLLTCVEEILAFPAAAPESAGIVRLATALREIENVQILEKSKFWRVFDRMPQGRARARMRDLWNRAYTLDR